MEGDMNEERLEEVGKRGRERRQGKEREMIRIRVKGRREEEVKKGVRQTVRR